MWWGRRKRAERITLVEETRGEIHETWVEVFTLQEQSSEGPDLDAALSGIMARLRARLSPRMAALSELASSGRLESFHVRMALEQLDDAVVVARSAPCGSTTTIDQLLMSASGHLVEAACRIEFPRMYRKAAGDRPVSAGPASPGPAMTSVLGPQAPPSDPDRRHGEPLSRSASPEATPIRNELRDAFLPVCDALYWAMIDADNLEGEEPEETRRELARIMAEPKAELEPAMAQWTELASGDRPESPALRTALAALRAADEAVRHPDLAHAGLLGTTSQMQVWRWLELAEANVGWLVVAADEGPAPQAPVVDPRHDRGEPPRTTAQATAAPDRHPALPQPYRDLRVPWYRRLFRR